MQNISIAQTCGPRYPEENVAPIGHLDASGLRSGSVLLGQLCCPLRGHAAHCASNKGNDRMLGNEHDAAFFFCAPCLMDPFQSIDSALCRSMQRVARYGSSASQHTFRANGSSAFRHRAFNSFVASSPAILIGVSTSKASACSIRHPTSHLILSPQVFRAIA